MALRAVDAALEAVLGLDWRQAHAARAGAAAGAGGLAGACAVRDEQLQAVGLEAVRVVIYGGVVPTPTPTLANPTPVPART